MTRSVCARSANSINALGSSSPSRRKRPSASAPGIVYGGGDHPMRAARATPSHVRLPALCYRLSEGLDHHREWRRGDRMRSARSATPRGAPRATSSPTRSDQRPSSHPGGVRRVLRTSSARSAARRGRRGSNGRPLPRGRPSTLPRGDREGQARRCRRRRRRDSSTRGRRRRRRAEVARESARTTRCKFAHNSPVKDRSSGHLVSIAVAHRGARRRPYGGRRGPRRVTPAPSPRLADKWVGV